MRKFLALLVVLVLMTSSVALANGIGGIGAWSFDFSELNMYFMPYDGMTIDMSPDTPADPSNKTQPKKLFSVTGGSSKVAAGYEAYADSTYKTFSDYVVAFCADIDAAFPDLTSDDYSKPETYDLCGNEAFTFSFRVGDAMDVDVLLIDSPKSGVYSVMLMYPSDNSGNTTQKLLDCFDTYSS